MQTQNTKKLWLWLAFAISASGFAGCTDTVGRDYTTGLRLLNASGGEKKAEVHFLRAAREGHAGAQLQAGLLLTRPGRAEADRRQGVTLLVRAANRKNAHAQYALALILLGTEAAFRDPPSGMAWLHQSASSGHEPAMCELARRYQVGENVQADPLEGVRWYKREIGRAHV